MFSDTNLTIITGTLVEDPVVTERKGEYLLRFTICNNRQYKNKTGGYTGIATFIDYQRWYKSKPRFLDNWLKKGAKIEVIGVYDNAKFVGRDGVKKTATFISMDSFHILKTAKQVENEANKDKPKEPLKPEPEEEYGISDEELDALSEHIGF